MSMTMATSNLLSSNRSDDGACLAFNDTQPSMLQSEGHMYFIDMKSSWYFFVELSVLTLLATRMFFHWHIPNVTARHLGIVNLLLTITSTVPFLVYLSRGVTWSGTTLPDYKRFMIDHLHATLLFAWAFVSTLGTVAIVFKKRKFHAILGKFSINVLMPIVLIELNTNAMRVFLPDKPRVLAMGYWPLPGQPEPPLWQLIAFSFPIANALLVPLLMTMFWWLSRAALYDTKTYPDPKTRHRLHMTYSTLLMMVTNSVGLLRWMFRLVYSSTGCPTFADNIISVAVQHLSSMYLATGVITLASLVYATVPIEMRQRKSSTTKQSAKYIRTLEVSFWLFLAHVLIPLSSSFLLGLPSSFRCNPDAMKEASFSTY